MIKVTPQIKWIWYDMNKQFWLTYFWKKIEEFDELKVSQFWHKNMISGKYYLFVFKSTKNNNLMEDLKVETNINFKNGIVMLQTKFALIASTKWSDYFPIVILVVISFCTWARMSNVVVLRDVLRKIALDTRKRSRSIK